MCEKRDKRKKLLPHTKYYFLYKIFSFIFHFYVLVRIFLLSSQLKHFHCFTCFFCTIYDTNDHNSCDKRPLFVRKDNKQQYSECMECGITRAIKSELKQIKYKVEEKKNM